MFCVETAIKLYYFSHIIYFYEKACLCRHAQTCIKSSTMESPGLLGGATLFVMVFCDGLMATYL